MELPEHQIICSTSMLHSQDMGLVHGPGSLLAGNAGAVAKLAILFVVLAVGIALGRLARQVKDVQRMQQRLSSVPRPPVPSKPLQRFLHEWLGPVLPLYRSRLARQYKRLLARPRCTYSGPHRALAMPLQGHALGGHAAMGH